MSVPAGLLLVVLVAAIGPCSNQRAVPQPNPRTGYAIEVSVGDREFAPLIIDAEGNGCDRFSSSQDAERTCFLATNVIPTIIGGEGEVNEKRTPALDALIWRARTDGDPAICAAGGLEGAFLLECEQRAVATAYEYAVADIRVRVPIGGAVPASTPG